MGTNRKQVKLVKGRENERQAYELFNEMVAVHRYSYCLFAVNDIA